MKISTKSRYALRMLLDLAEHENEGFIALKDIAARQNISKKYLSLMLSIFIFLFFQLWLFTRNNNDNFTLYNSIRFIVINQLF